MKNLPVWAQNTLSGLFVIWIAGLVTLFITSYINIAANTEYRLDTESKIDTVIESTIRMEERQKAILDRVQKLEK